MSKIDRYHEIRKIGKEQGDDNFCSVIALAVALDISYEQSWNLFRMVGRRANKGVSDRQIQSALRTAGVVFESIKVTAKTVRTFKYKGNFIVTTCNHALAHQDGETLDHSAGTKRRIECVYKINHIPTNIGDSIAMKPVVNKPRRPRKATTIGDYKYAIVHVDSKTVGKLYKRRPRINLYRRGFQGIAGSMNNLRVVNFNLESFRKDPDTFWENLGYKAN